MGRVRYTIGAGALTLALLLGSPAIASAAEASPASPANIAVDRSCPSMIKPPAAPTVDLPRSRAQSSPLEAPSSFFGFGGFSFGGFGFSPFHGFKGFSFFPFHGFGSFGVLPFRGVFHFIFDWCRHLIGGRGGGGQCA